MKFSEIELYEAIYDVRAELKEPGADSWALDIEKRNQLCRMIQTRLTIGAPFTTSEMMRAWFTFRKRTDQKANLIVEICRTHGRRCFWSNRGLGNCCDEITIDRLIPGSRGGAYNLANCVLACKTHNSLRKDQSIEQFLNSGQRNLFVTG
jgi:hypothetical protein